MKLVRFQHAGSDRVGLVEGSAGDAEPTLRVIAAPENVPDPMIPLLALSPDEIQAALTGEAVPLGAVRLASPIRQPSKNVICIGKNYAAHAKEFAGSGYDSSGQSASDSTPQAPILFSKAPCSLSGPYDEIQVPWAVTSEVDYEAELGVVIGKEGLAIRPDDAYQHVWGYTIINDVTARDLQSKHQQWFLGKSIDTFCPMGPWIVSADELDPEDLSISCWVNGELRQDAHTGDMIYSIPEIIAAASACMTLLPGDIISTGTPVGVGIGFDPPRFLQKGDVIRIAISRIGEIQNTVA